MDYEWAVFLMRATGWIALVVMTGFYVREARRNFHA